MLRERWLPWKAGLYILEVTSPQGCSFQMSGLAYDILTENTTFLESTKKSQIMESKYKEVISGDKKE